MAATATIKNRKISKPSTRIRSGAWGSSDEHCPPIFLRSSKLCPPGGCVSSPLAKERGHQCLRVEYVPGTHMWGSGLTTEHEIITPCVRFHPAQVTEGRRQKSRGNCTEQKDPVK